MCRAALTVRIIEYLSIFKIALINATEIPILVRVGEAHYFVLSRCQYMNLYRLALLVLLPRRIEVLEVIALQKIKRLRYARGSRWGKRKREKARADRTGT